METSRGTQYGSPAALAGLIEDAREFAGVKYLPASRQLVGDRGRAQLSRRESAVLQILVDNADRVVPRERIYELVWGDRMPHRDRAVDVYVRRVRLKLRELAPDERFIHTHFGIGYRFSAER